ncbi:hypothetical protein Scep_000811 [Stephania cephalantha]|uniref:LysM domain receptor-like kinase 4 n=1 Tax=Stephania cephalantha TaxID=152367 RepID=A0AAP0L7V0_9MAGN
MKLNFVLFVFISSLTSSSLILAQQPYVGKATTDCGNSDKSTSVLGYTCNGQSSSCQAYLIFRSQPPYTTVSSISSLLASDPLQLSKINSVSDNATFQTNKEVIVPVNCSCSGGHYQVNSTYVVKQQDTYLFIANNTFQGLSTCQAIQNQNRLRAEDLLIGARIYVPLRCACPTKDQAAKGVKYLMSYLVTWGEFVAKISGQFGVQTESTLEANELSEQNDVIFPFTTLLVPLEVPPSSSQTIEPEATPPMRQHHQQLHSHLSLCCCLLHGLRGKRKSRNEQSKRKDDPIIDSRSFESVEKPLKTTEEDSEELLASIAEIGQSLKVYKFRELQSATDNFSPSCWIKGSVYKGTINGSLSAIKITNRDVSNEINLLTKINHFNLIKLSGICFHEGRWYLVFEYAANGSLTDWIYSHMNINTVLSWAQRVQIALDVASGLNYLHSYTNPPHVHKDIKSSNILLDHEFRAKIANFTLARSAEGHENEFALTRHIVGTKGYMAPEYLEYGIITPKLDVYSLGVVMLELITGKEAIDTSGERDVSISMSLTTIFQDENPKEALKDFIDSSLEGNYPIDLALFLARLIENSLRKNPAERPGMDDIVRSLSSISAASWNNRAPNVAPENQSFHNSS